MSMVVWFSSCFLFGFSFFFFSFLLIFISFILLIFPLLLAGSEHLLFQPKTLFFSLFRFMVFSLFSSSHFFFFFLLHYLLAKSSFTSLISNSHFFSFFISIFFVSSLTSLISCFAPLFIGNDKACRTFNGGLIMAISSIMIISTLNHESIF